MATDSLLARAHRLEKLAKVARDESGDRQDVEKLKLAADTFSQRLEALRVELAVRRSLEKVDAVGPLTQRLAADAASLRSHVAERGRPTVQKVQAAARGVDKSIAALETESLNSWATWAEQRLSTLPRHKVAGMSEGDRRRIETVMEELRTAARRAPNAAGVELFARRIEQVRTELDEVALDPATLDVLAKFAGSVPVALSELTDEDLRTLRSDPALAAQFLVRRQ